MRQHLRGDRAHHQVAQRAEALGFRDLWVTENTLDHVFCFDPMVILTYAAALNAALPAAEAEPIPME